MLPGGCGRNKAGRPGGRYRRAFVLGNGDDPVVDGEAVADLGRCDELRPDRPR